MYVSVVMFAVIVDTFHLSSFVSVVSVCLLLEKGVSIENVFCVVYLKLIIDGRFYIQRYSPLSSRLAAHLLYVIVNEGQQFFYSAF